MNEGIFFGSYPIQLNDYNIIKTINNKSDLCHYNNITIIVEKLNVFGDVIDILNVRENYLKPNNLSIYIINQDLLFSEWTDSHSDDFELCAMISYISTIDKNVFDKVCNKITNINEELKSGISMLKKFNLVLFDRF